MFVSAATLSLSAMSVMASGSFSSGGGVGFHNTYNLGKAVFYKKLACDDCPVQGSHLQRDDAKALVNKLNSDDMFLPEVSGQERRAVIFYITRRYKTG